MLAMYPHYQERVFNEMKLIFPEQNSNISPDELCQLVYTECFIKEVLRMCPTVPLISRRASTPTKIGTSHTLDKFITIKFTLIIFQKGSLDIPTGTELGLSIFHLHRNKDVWGPEADLFNPDNFLPENICKIHKYAFIPYSSGPRNCIGKLNK